MFNSVFEESHEFMCDTYHFGKTPGSSITLNYTLKPEIQEEPENYSRTMKCQSQLIDKRKDNC